MLNRVSWYLSLLCAIFLISISPLQADLLTGTILNKDDLDLENSQEGPYTSSRGAPSFNEWRCFHVSDAFPECIDGGVEFSSFHGRTHLSPCIQISESSGSYTFVAYNMSQGACKNAANEIKKLMEGEDTVCIYGALLFVDRSKIYPSYNDETWVMHRAKTLKGTWIGPTDIYSSDGY